MKALFSFLVGLFLLFTHIASAQTLTQVRVYFNGNDAQAQYFAVPSAASIDQPFTVDVSSLPRGVHTMYVEVQDNQGRWSLYDHDNIHVMGGLQMATVNACEYFFNTDPGFGEGIQIPLNASNINQSFDLDLAGLPNGLHVAYVRVRDGANQWSLYAQHVFQVVGSMHEELVEAEYFFNIDPGLGNGQSISLSDLSFNGSLELSLAGLPNGVHTLYIRVKDAQGIWSLFSQHNIEVRNPQPGTILVYAEYYFDTDPGQGNAIPLVVTQSSVIDGNFSISLPPSLIGTHTICVRVKDINGQWSSTVCEAITICSSQVPSIAIVGQDCQSTPFVLMASGGYDSYTWSNGLTGQSITVTEPGNYSVNAESGGCSASAAVDAQFDYLPQVTFSVQGGNCAGDSQTISFEDVYDNIVWQDGQVSPEISVTETGNYIVTVTNGSCTANFSTEVSFFEPQEIEIFASGTACLGNELNLNISGNYTAIEWSNGGDSFNTAVTESGVYTVSAFEQGCATQGSISVDFSSPPIFEIEQTGGVCEGEEVVLSVPTGFDAYQWSEGSLTVTQSVTNSGIYSVAVTDGNCVVNQSVEVTLIELPQPGILQNGNVLACSISDASQYQWYLNGVPISGANAQFYSAVSGGFYSVEVEEGGCFASSPLFNFTTTHTEEQSAGAMRMYPNPSCDYFICDAPESLIQSVEVIDVTGKIVITQRPNTAFVRIDTTSLSAGLYMVRVLSDNGTVVCRQMEKVLSH